MPTKNPFIRERMERKREMLTFIVKQSKNPKALMTVERIIGVFSWKWGLRTSVINQYIKELEMAELIQIENGIVKPTEYAKALLYKDLGVFNEPLDRRRRSWKKKKQQLEEEAFRGTTNPEDLPGITTEDQDYEIRPGRDTTGPKGSIRIH